MEAGVCLLQTRNGGGVGGTERLSCPGDPQGPTWFHLQKITSYTKLYCLQLKNITFPLRLSSVSFLPSSLNFMCSLSKVKEFLISLYFIDVIKLFTV